MESVVRVFTKDVNCSHHAEEDGEEHKTMEQAKGDDKEEHLDRESEEDDQMDARYLEECSEEVVVREGKENCGKHCAQTAIQHGWSNPAENYF